jgi:membrane protein implicated in regulation of membrane protease activity
MSSASDAGSQVLVAFTDPSALGGIAVLAAAAALLGLVLRTHPALALVGTVIWAAALAAGLAYVGDGAQSTSAAIAIVIVALAVAARAGVSRREEPARQPALASAQPALHG